MPKLYWILLFGWATLTRPISSGILNPLSAKSPMFAPKMRRQMSVLLNSLPDVQHDDGLAGFNSKEMSKIYGVGAAVCGKMRSQYPTSTQRLNLNPTW